jgi:hypothetical protein
MSPEDLSAFQLAAFWSDYLAVRKHVERESEHLVLVGALSHRRELRHATHLGELARAERHAALRAAGARRLEEREDGAPLRASGCGTPRGIRGQHGKSRHNYGTTSGFSRHSPIATGEKLKRIVVARGGIEPPTRGFSVLQDLYLAAPRIT